MKITMDFVKSKGACAEGIRYFKEKFGGEGEYQEILDKLADEGNVPWASWLIGAVGAVNAQIVVEGDLKNDYVFVSEEFQQRLVIVLPSLAYATLCIMFFRQAFMWAGFPRSELPTILLALNFILFQIALIVLISKEQLLSIIPTSTDGWRLIKDQFGRFYYLILLCVIAIIVMSNPYVGYGRLVLFVLSGILYSFILVLNPL